jgi:bifunctional non-homologous end joining protein LigD
MPAMPQIEFCLPTTGKAVPSGPDWIHEVKYDGLYEASRVKKFFEINIFSFPAFQEASRRVSAVLR